VSEEPVFTEAVIYIPVFGCYAGEYIAECTSSQCGYLGQSPSIAKKAARADDTPAPLHRIYQVANIPVRAFPPRGKLGVFLRTQVLTTYEESGTACPLPVLHHWELECMPRPLKRTYAQAGK